MTWPINYQSLLLLDGWLEFNRYKWNVEPVRLRLSEEGKDLPAIEAVVYLDKNGRIVQPPLNPYLPIAFHPTPTKSVTKLYRQWQALSCLLVEEFLKRGTKGIVAFPPEIIDVRQWQWHGFMAEACYTFYINLPYNISFADYSVRKQVEKAEKAGLTCRIATPNVLGEVILCLSETEERQKFSYGLDEHDLQVALSLLEDIFRVYICTSDSGEIASVRVVLSAPGMRAIDWVAGTRRKFLSSGATQLLIEHILHDLSRLDATGFDFVGANLPSVSAAKADWGGTLMPYYGVRCINLRTMASLGLRMLRHWRGRK